MKREEKIDLLVASLAKLIAEGRDDKEGYESAPQISFLSEKEVRIEEFPGKQLPVNKVYENDSLTNWLECLFEYYYDDEKRHYTECLCEEDEEAFEKFQDEGIYDEDNLPDHIYHVIRSFAELIGKTV